MGLTGHGAVVPLVRSVRLYGDEARPATSVACWVFLITRNLRLERTGPEHKIDAARRLNVREGGPEWLPLLCGAVG